MGPSDGARRRRGGGAGRGPWAHLHRGLSDAARLPLSTVARRITLDSAGRLQQTVSVTVPVDHEAHLRALVSRLTRLERSAGVTVTLPQSRDERDAWLQEAGALRLCPAGLPFSAQGVDLACDFRLAPLLDDLLTEACLGGYPLAYQIHLRAVGVDPEWERTARKNVLALRAVRGAGYALIDWQERLARTFGHASAISEEYLLVESQDVAEPVERFVASRFCESYAPLGFPPAPFRFEQDGHAEALHLGVHSHDLTPLTPMALCGAALSPADSERLLAWQPSPQLQGLLATPPDAEAPTTAPPAEVEGLPQPYDGPGPYAFVSYKRQDLPRIAPLLASLEGHGIPVWYDRGIPGGAEWDEVIEHRLSSAHFVVLTTSQAAVESKYVRREVKLADALNIPVLALLLDDVRLTHGMNLLLTASQMLDMRAVDFKTRLGESLAYLMHRA